MLTILPQSALAHQAAVAQLWPNLKRILTASSRPALDKSTAICACPSPWWN